MLTLQVLNSDATLNNFDNIDTQTFSSGETVEVLMRIMQTDRGIRYIPEAAATITFDLVNKDNTTLTKTATHPFTDDRSLIKIQLTSTETANLVSQSLVAKIDESGKITFAIKQSGLQRVALSNQDC